MNATPPPLVRRRRAQLVLIALLFFGPLGLAFYAYYGGSLIPARHTNHGELVVPARTLPAAGLVSAGGTAAPAGLMRGTWTLVQLTGGACEASCQAALAASRAARLGLHEPDRVRRLLIVDAACCASPLAAAADDLTLVWLDGEAGRRVAATFPGYAAGAPAGQTYLVDPLGNLMMSYPAGAPAKGMLKDLEHLLRLSHIG
jgi:hypothetical protein